MTGKVHYFDSRLNGGYHMSLFYPASEPAHRGKTAEGEDSFTSRFVELLSPERIVQSITFVADDPAYYGQMTLEATFVASGGGTEVTITCMDIPPGIRPEDNEAGCRSSLEKLARYVEQ